MKLFIVPEMTFRGHSRSLTMGQFNEPHIIFYSWSVVTICLSCIVSEIFNANVACPWNLRGHSPCEFMYDLHIVKIYRAGPILLLLIAWSFVHV